MGEFSPGSSSILYSLFFLNIYENPDKRAFKVKPGRIVGNNFSRSIRGVKTCAQATALPVSWFARGLAFVHVDWLFHNQLQNL